MVSSGDLARQLMTDFAERTGLVGGGPVTRYLWTDAFATCNLLGLNDLTGDDRWLDLAIRLVDQVHDILGRHREDDPRSGWISGLDEEEGQRRPTAGGLRIGKKLGELGPSRTADAREEWERDGQYFHYLTKWMHALARASRHTGDRRYLDWAVELAVVADDRFVVRGAGGRPQRMVWKMSIDLSRPLVPSMGQHDPLDGLVTFHELAAADPDAELGQPIADMATLCDEISLPTLDPLGIGGLLTDAWKVASLEKAGASVRPDLLEELVSASAPSLDRLASSNLLDRPPVARLPFRELGLSIGLHGVDRLQKLLAGPDSPAAADRALHRGVLALASRRGLAETIESTWSEPTARRVGTWLDHRDINEVMLATSLAPDAYLEVA